MSAQGEGCRYGTYPDGQGRSKLRPLRLGAARNWETVVTLAAVAAGE